MKKTSLSKASCPTKPPADPPKPPVKNLAKAPKKSKKDPITLKPSVLTKGTETLYVVIDGCVREGKVVPGGVRIARRKTVTPLTKKLVRFSSLSEALRSRQVRAVQIGDKRFVLQQRSR